MLKYRGRKNTGADLNSGDWELRRAPVATAPMTIIIIDLRMALLSSDLSTVTAESPS